MHSGKDAGLSGAFGVGRGAGPFGGGSLVERNLNRWTVGFAIAFVINTIILLRSLDNAAPFPPCPLGVVDPVTEHLDGPGGASLTRL